MTTDDLLRRDVRMLADLLGDTIRRLAGRHAFELVEEVRKLCRGRREGDADSEARLFAKMRSLDPDDVAVLIRAFSIFFDLVNLAEDRHRARVLRDRRRDQPDAPAPESIAAAVQTLHDRRVAAPEVANLLRSLRIELVFTAHPTEAKRRTVRQKVRDIREALAELDQDLLPVERDAALARIEAAVVGLWQSDFLRPRRPTVLEEVRRGLSFAPTLWSVAPRIVSDLRTAVRRLYPEIAADAPAFLTFGSWIGGDRDGHPFVTADVTEQTLAWLRETALEYHLARAEELHAELSMSAHATAIDPEVEAVVEGAVRRFPDLRPELEPVSPQEAYRRLISVVMWRLERTRTSGGAEVGSYSHHDELLKELETAAASLRRHGAECVADARLQTWIDEVRVFGLHFAKLDVRQESSYYTAVLDDLFGRLGQPGYANLGEGERSKRLSMPAAGFPALANAADETVETVALFRMLVRAVGRFGEDVLGGHVISMTRAPSDLLAVYWLWETALAEASLPTGKPKPRLAIVPLFETIDDLTRAGATLSAAWRNPVYAEVVRKLGNEQIVMVGYSDSTKDGGYLAATWALHQAEAAMAQAAQAAGIRLVLFHGRGGALGRGGGPAARGILSLPPAAVRGALRMTEQGEVLAERYDDPAIAHRHLEQVTWATMLVSSLPAEPPKPEWLTALDEMARLARIAYRALVDEPGFMEFFRTATPIDEIEQLSIGSRPSRRKGKAALSDLRAIPWVFAWTQNRLLIPAWYGLGAGLTVFAERAGWPALHEMYRAWPYFRATIDNAALALAKADLTVAREYTQLTADEDLRDRMWKKIETEYARTRSAVVRTKRVADLLADVPWFEKSLKKRNPYVDPLNLLQVELFRRLRTEENSTDGDRLRELSRLAIKGIAAGMRTTG